jgi:hypothetical protein
MASAWHQHCVDKAGQHGHVGNMLSTLGSTTLGMASAWDGVSRGMASGWVWCHHGHGVTMGMVPPWGWCHDGHGVTMGTASSWAWCHHPGHGVNMGVQFGQISCIVVYILCAYLATMGCNSGVIMGVSIASSWGMGSTWSVL